MRVNFQLFLGAVFGSLVFAAPVAADQSENVFWQSISDSKDGAEFCAYLSAYPTGKFASLARIRAKKYGGDCTAASTAAPTTITPADRPATITPADRAAPAAPKVKKSFFASDNYFDGKMAFDAQDYPKAVALWMESANQGAPEAQGLIGGMYHAGLGVEKDFAQAMDWYMKAAVKGVAQAQLGIGNLYGDGLGVDKDYVQARMWFAISANGGNERAKYNMEKVSQRMNADDIAKSEKMALDWLKKHKLL